MKSKKINMFIRAYSLHFCCSNCLIFFYSVVIHCDQNEPHIFIKIIVTLSLIRCLTSCCFSRVSVASSLSSSVLTFSCFDVSDSSLFRVRAQCTMALCLSRRRCSSCSPASAACSLSPVLPRSIPAAAVSTPDPGVFLPNIIRRGV